jgi:hypothetical protein
MSERQVETELEVEGDLHMQRIDERYRDLLLSLMDILDAAEQLDRDVRRELIVHGLRSVYLKGLVDGLIKDVP